MRKPLSIAVSFALLGATACSDDDGTTTPTPTPTLAITAPTAGAAVATEVFDVTFTTTNFTLKAPGTCAGAADCGHVHLLVDGAACNADGSPYNAAGAASPIQADLGHCDTAAGSHTVTLELHNDDHSPVLDGASVVSRQVAVTYTPASPNAPSITITAPTPGATVATEAFDVAFTTANFTLKAPGTCAGAAGCGHVHLLVDGAACNADGTPYNNAGAASPLEADLGLCDTATGTHAVKLELHNDDHSPVLDGANVVSATVSVTFTEVATGPAIAITSPAPAASVDLAADFTVPIAITPSNFTLAAPGTCAGAADCGHVHLLVDGADCNDAGTPYNNAGAGSSIAAKLALCADVEGEHVATVELHNDDHSPVKGAGDATVSANVTFTVASSKPRILIVSPAGGASVTPSGATKTVPIAFKLAGFRLAAAGTCDGDTACGHAHLTIDGTACNAAGRPYNNNGEASPMDAILSECDTVPGAHTVSIALAKDDHSPLKDGGTTVQATVTFTAQ